MGCPPATVYKGARGGGPAKEEEARPRGAILLQLGFPPSFQVLLGEGKEGEEKEKEGEGGEEGKGGRPPSPIRFGLGGPRTLPPLFHHLAHEAHCFLLVFP